MSSKFSDALFVFVSTVRNFTDKYLVIVVRTWEIFSDVMNFSGKIKNTKSQLNDSIIYLAEVFALNLVLQHFLLDITPNPRFAELPFGSELGVFLALLPIVIYAILVALALSFRNSSEPKFYATVAAHLYFYGFFVLCQSASYPLISPLTGESDFGILTSIFMIPAIVIMMKGLLSVIALFGWVADVNEVSIVMAFLSYWGPALVLGIVVGVLSAVLSVFAA